MNYFVNKSIHSENNATEIITNRSFVLYEDIFGRSIWEFFLLNSPDFILSFINITTNATLVFVFIKQHKVRNRPNTYIFSLAIANLIAVLSNIITMLQLYVTNDSSNWIWSLAHCKWFFCTIVITYGVSIFTIVALTIERYYVTIKPLKSLQQNPPPGVGFIWILAILFVGHFVFLNKIEALPFKLNRTLYTCIGNPQEYFSSSVILLFFIRFQVFGTQIIYFIIPALLIIIFHGLWEFQLKTGVKNIPDKFSPTQKRALEQNKRYLERLVPTFILSFLFFYIPTNIIYLIISFNPDSPLWNHTVVTILKWLSNLHYSVEPIALYFSSGVYRENISII